MEEPRTPGGSWPGGVTCSGISGVSLRDWSKALAWPDGDPKHAATLKGFSVTFLRLRLLSCL